MIRARTFVYDAQLDCVVELLEGSVIAPSFGELHDRTKDENRKATRTQRTADALRQVTLERASRREFAHQRYGTESRWRD